MKIGNFADSKVTANMQIMDTKVIGPNHPAFSLNGAWYLFAAYAPDGKVERLFKVEAKNRTAIQFLETIMGEDGAVSPTCVVLMINKEEPVVRSRGLEEISYIDFVIEIVDHDRFLNSPLLIQIFQKSMTLGDRLRAGARLQRAIKIHAAKPEIVPVSMPETVTDAGTDPVDLQKVSELEQALIGLGFKRPRAIKFVHSVTSEFGKTPIEDLLRRGVQVLSKAE